MIENKELNPEELTEVTGGGADGPHYCFHKVKEGETLQSIATLLKVSIASLISWNNLMQGIPLIIGQSLRYIPRK